ncbi:MAG: PfaD family polyunsaturated fatty acid/polyketide biosynthesis protein [Elusimicrobiota bacterium]
MPLCLTTPKKHLGTWHSDAEKPASDVESVRAAIFDLNKPLFVLDSDGAPVVVTGGEASFGARTGEGQPVLAYAPPLAPDELGDDSFRADFGLRYAYVSGAMANGIASADICETLAREGMLGIFGSAGLPPTVVENNIDRLQASLDDAPFGCNLIHSPNEPDIERAVADLFIRKGVRIVEASAYMTLTLPIVRYRVYGIHRDGDGTIVTPNRVIGKVSRAEVATQFFSPPPEKMLQELVAAGDITAEQAELAAQIPMAQDLTAEADSGGHTDNRPLVTLLPTMVMLRDRHQLKYGYAQNLRVGAAGGISTPFSAAAAFAMGAAYVVLGSVHQSCVESGTSDIVRELLSQADQADVASAPSADMFEIGAKVQVLKRGTMFAMRANKLHDLYRSCAGLDDIPAVERAQLEKQIFKAPLEEIWTQTRAFFEKRDPSQVEKAESNPKHKMALVFRWYLGQASRWANAGEPSRRMDYQIWCGPAMGAFNEWAKGSYLEKPENRWVADVAKNILYGAAVHTRLNMLRNQGVRFFAEVAQVPPLEPSAMEEYFK